jgi:hypothetical protein
MPGGEKNTFGLPDGEAIRREMVSIFREQRLAILDWMDTEGFKGFGLPIAWPSWESLKLGAADIASRVRGPISDIWETFLDVSDPVVAVRIDSQANALGIEVNQGTSSILNRLLSGVKDLYDRGKKTLAESIKDLRKGVVEEIKPMEAWRARRIAVTEASRAYHEAMGLRAWKSGVVTGWKWLTAEGACPLCLMIEEEAQFVRLDQPFALIGTGLYSVIEFPPAHPNCRCTVEEVVFSDEQPEWSETLIDPVPPKLIPVGVNP